MVPAANEHKSANEPKDDTSTRGTFFGRQKFWKRCKQEEEEPARLTPMPACLMHWWTPLAIAEGLLRWPLLLAVFWGGQPHWPSSEAMKLCVTIVGAGLAFSAWQQRSHDNAVKKDEQAQAQHELERERLENDKRRQDEQERYERERKAHERNRLEQIERDEYWKRREQIYQLLGSENPGLRLGAVALLAELADSAAHSTLLNKNEKQQLQRHIINTLCLQVRHEGLCNSSEGTEEEHAGMQKAIIEIISSRIRKPQRNSTVANWTKELIEITDSKILTPIRWKHITTEAIFNFQGTTFFESFVIIDSTIRWIEWDTSRFLKSLIIKSITHQTIIGTRTIPTQAKEALFTKVTFKLPETLNRFEMRMNPTSIGYQISVNSCTFIHRSCSCSNAAKCTCTNSVSQVPIVINFLKTDKALSSHAKHGTLQIKNCQTQDITGSSELSVVGGV